MQRRNLLLLSATLGLGGCGFALRGAPELTFGSMYLNAPDNSPFGREIRRTLSSLDSLRLVDAHEQAAADTILDLLFEARDKTVVGVNTSGEVREFQLRTRMRFKLRTPKGKELISETELTRQIDISYTESAALAKEAEEAILYRHMQTDIVQQLIRRLAAVRSL